MRSAEAHAKEQASPERLERYQALVELSAYALLVHANDQIVFVNSAFARLIGATDPSELIGRATLDLVHPDARRAAVHQIDSTLQDGGTAAPVEQTWVRLDGAPVVVEATATPLPFQNDVAVQIILRDRTELLKVDRELRKVQRQMRALVEEVENLAIFSVDTQGRVDGWNIGAQRMFGYTEPEILGRPFDVIFTEEDRRLGAPAWEIEEAARTGIAQDERWHERKDGTRFFVSGFLISVRRASGDLVGFTKIAQDHTERKRAEEALRASESRYRQLSAELESKVAERTRYLEQSIQAWEGFCYSIAHDLRAPLRTVSGFADALLEDYGQALDPRGQSYTKRMAAAAHRMDEFIQDLLDFGRLAHVELPRRPIGLKEALDDVLTELAGEIRSTGAQIELQGTFPQVLANPAAMKQVLANLLTNAMKFVSPGTRPRIEVRAEERADTVRLWIRDYGIGIRPEHHDRVFRLFERLHSQSEYPGTGAGLAIVLRAVERMGGKVGLESVPGEGTSFWIELSKGTSALEL